MKLIKLLFIFTFSLSAYAGEFNLLTYNVAGLPKIITENDQNGERFHPYVSPLLNDYNIVLVQEDFAYHKLLIENAGHPYFSKFKRRGFFLLGDGLNRLSNFPFQGFTRIKWTKCFGVLKNGNDCLTPKGFSVATHELEPGVFVDIYNIHGEAGNPTKGDDNARAKNTKQLIEYVKNHSKGRAVILAGDSNLHESILVEKNHLKNILNSLGLKDTCKEFECGSYEFVDKIFYRSGYGVKLTALDWTSDAEIFKDDEGNRLSDHPPVAARFNWEISERPKKIITLKALHSSLCLGKINGQAVQVDCQERAGFEMIPTADKSVVLMDTESKKCLDIRKGSKRSRRNLILSPCHFKNNQRFYQEKLPNGKLTMKAKHSGKCLDVNKFDKNPGARVIQFKCHQRDNQLWDVKEELF